jgi:hypothetical protein
VIVSLTTSSVNQATYFSVLGEPSFKSLADIETPTGMSSDLSDTLQSADASGASVLSSTAIDGANFSPANLDVSSIETEVLFCNKCGQIFQK